VRVEWIGAWRSRQLVLDLDGMGGRQGRKKRWQVGDSWGWNGTVSGGLVEVNNGQLYGY